MTSSSGSKPEEQARAFYFGTYQQPGHYLFDEHMNKVCWTGYGESFRYEDCPLPFTHIDGRFNPSEVEGETWCGYGKGWTVIAFANRTDDKRPGSNSAFFFEGNLTFDEAVAAAKSRFPQVMGRLPFEIERTTP